MVDNEDIVEYWVFCLRWKQRLAILVFIQGFKKYLSLCWETLAFCMCRKLRVPRLNMNYNKVGICY